MRKAILISTILLTLLISFVLLYTQLKQMPSEELEFAPTKGAYAPNFVGQRLGGGDFSLASLQGQWLVLNFWATWCVPCRQEMPELQALYADTGIMVIGVNLAESEELVADWIEDYGISYPIVLDPNEEIHQLYRVMGQPMTFIINPDGLIVEVIAGATTADALLAKIDE